MPRRYEAAAKPAMSPVTPPPSAATQSVRVSWDSARNSRMAESVVKFLCASPAGNT